MFQAGTTIVMVVLHFLYCIKIHILLEEAFMKS